MLYLNVNIHSLWYISSAFCNYMYNYLILWPSYLVTPTVLSYKILLLRSQLLYAFSVYCRRFQITLQQPTISIYVLYGRENPKQEGQFNCLFTTRMLVGSNSHWLIKNKRLMRQKQVDFASWMGYDIKKFVSKLGDNITTLERKLAIEIANYLSLTIIKLFCCLN